MSTARRAYDILRGYVADGWERLQGNEESLAESELRQAVEQPYEVPPPTERAARPDSTIASMSVETARRLLDVPPNATTKQITEAHDRLKAGIDPTKFPEGSDARNRAKRLNALCGAAYRVLCDNMDPTIKRFEGLQIE